MTMHGYKFMLSKKLDKRLWTVIGIHLKTLEYVAVSDKFSHSSATNFENGFEKWYAFLQSVFGGIF